MCEGMKSQRVKRSCEFTLQIKARLIGVPGDGCRCIEHKYAWHFYRCFFRSLCRGPWTGAETEARSYSKLHDKDHNMILFSLCCRGCSLCYVLFFFIVDIRATKACLARAGGTRSEVLHLQLIAQDRRLQGAPHL